MGLPQLKSCYCGCTLRTGTLILLWLSVILGVIALLTLVVCLPMVPMTANSSSNVPVPNILLVYGLIFLTVSILTVVDIAGLFGVYKDRHSYLIPHLSLDGSFIVLLTISYLVAAIVLPFAVDKKHVYIALAGSAWLVISAFLAFALNAYHWLVVYSYYRVVKERSSSRSIA